MPCGATRVVLTLLVATSSAYAADAPPVPYPEGYRGWTHVKTMQIHDGHPLFAAFGGIHHLYANPQAMTGYRKGRFPDGAVIVFDLHEAVTAGGTTTAGVRKVVGVMRKDARAHAATGGWGFEGFKGDSATARAVGADAKTACFDCHAAQRDRDYVFSRYER